MTDNKKVPFKIKLGYGAAALSDGTAYVFFYSFFILFLTDYAMVNPVWAGTISTIVVLWDAITDPIVGWLSDNCKSKMGRRRPFFLIGIIPWMITIVLMFTAVDLDPVPQFAYYVVMACLFWTSYTLCDVPYKAFGAEITQDYNERGNIRMFVQVFSSTGTTIAKSFTLVFVAMFAGLFGCEDKMAWVYVGGLYAIISAIGYLTTFFAVKGWDKPMTERKEESKEKVNLLKTYIQLIKDVKPIRWLLVIIIVFMCGNSLYGSGIFYMYNYLVGWTPGQIAAAGLFTTFFGLGLPVVFGFLVKKIDKKVLLCVCLLISSIDMFAFKFIGISCTAHVFIYLALYALSNVGFWSLIWAIVYDTSEVDELLHGKRREGSATSICSLMQKAGSAAALQLVGLVLGMTGYDGAAAVQSAEAMEGILSMVTVIPGSFTLLACILLWAMPLNRKTFALVQKALKEKKETGTYSTEGLERLI